MTTWGVIPISTGVIGTLGQDILNRADTPLVRAVGAVSSARNIAACDLAEAKRTGTNERRADGVDFEKFVCDLERLVAVFVAAGREDEAWGGHEDGHEEVGGRLDVGELEDFEVQLGTY